MSAILLVLQVPLALLSLLLYKAVQWLMRRLANLHYRRRKEAAFRWSPLSAQTLRNPLALPVLMTSAPRWNPHAITATLGPLPVRETLTIDVSAARRSAASWSIVVYTFPGFRTITSVDSLQAAGDSVVLPLKPGRYWIGLRYYHWSEEVVLPSLSIDGKPAVEPMPLPSDVNAFYQELSRRRSWCYFALHYHAWMALRLRAWLPRRFVERIVLPVGNPGTRFYYGVLRPGERLRIEASAETLRDADIYLTLYSRASFPVAWERVTQGCHETERVFAPRLYLVRVHSRVAEKIKEIKVSSCAA